MSRFKYGYDSTLRGDLCDRVVLIRVLFGTRELGHSYLQRVLDMVDGMDDAESAGLGKISYVSSQTATLKCVTMMHSKLHVHTCSTQISSYCILRFHQRFNPFYDILANLEI